MAASSNSTIAYLFWASVSPVDPHATSLLCPSSLGWHRAYPIPPAFAASVYISILLLRSDGMTHLFPIISFLSAANSTSWSGIHRKLFFFLHLAESLRFHLSNVLRTQISDCTSLGS